jgi:ATP-dependent RNA helicase DeaD
MPEPGFESIEGLRISDTLRRGFAEDVITCPTAVQNAAIPPILAGHPVVVQSATGTGKTLAYLLPILQNLIDDAQARAVVFTPATELAMQILRTAEKYKQPEITTGALVATGSRKYQKSRVTKNTRLMAGTPGRILEQYAARKMKRVTTVVLDEPDPILTGKDADYLLEVLSRPDPKIQLILTGATIGPKAEALIGRLMDADLVRTQTKDAPLLTHISHSLEIISAGAAPDTCLSGYLKRHKCRRALVFVNQPNLIRHLFRHLQKYDLNPVSLSTDRSKLQRKQAIDSFLKAETSVLITTDKAARGLDLPELEWVLHYELPPSAEAYLHRAGRTGRAGKSGHSVVLVPASKRYLAERYAKELGIEFS